MIKADQNSIILIYPDGYIDKIKKDEREYHMEYLFELVNKSNRLYECLSNNHIYLPDNPIDARETFIFDINKVLANNGVLVINSINLCEIAMGNDFPDNYHVYLPSNLTDIQKELFRSILTDDDLKRTTIGKCENNEIIDINFDEYFEKTK